MFIRGQIIFCYNKQLLNEGCYLSPIKINFRINFNQSSFFKRQRAAKITVALFYYGHHHTAISLPCAIKLSPIRAVFLLFRQSVVIYLVRFFINKVVFGSFRQND